MGLINTLARGVKKMPVIGQPLGALWDVTQWGADKFLGTKPIFSENNKGSIPYLGLVNTRTKTGSNPAQPPQNQGNGGAWIDPELDPFSTGSRASSAAQIAYEKNQIAKAQAEYAKQRGNLEGQFKTLVKEKRGEIDSDYAEGKAKLTKEFGEQRETLKKGYDTSKEQGMARLAAKGISQSEESDNWLAEMLGTYDKNLGNINTGEADQLKTMDKQLKDAKSAIDRAEWNFWNELPKFGTVEEAMSYKSSLDKQKASIEDAIEKVNSASSSFRSSSASDYAGKGLLDMFEGVNKIVVNAEGLGIDPYESGLVKRFIGQFYKDPNKANQVYQGIVNSSQDRNLFG